MKYVIDLTEGLMDEVFATVLRDYYELNDPKKVTMRADKKSCRKVRKAIRRLYKYSTARDIRDDLD